jgi:hypothetical protein
VSTGRTNCGVAPRKQVTRRSVVVALVFTSKVRQLRVFAGAVAVGSTTKPIRPQPLYWPQTPPDSGGTYEYRRVQSTPFAEWKTPSVRGRLLPREATKWWLAEAPLAESTRVPAATSWLVKFAHGCAQKP